MATKAALRRRAERGKHSSRHNQKHSAGFRDKAHLTLDATSIDQAPEEIGNLEGTLTNQDGGKKYYVARNQFLVVYPSAETFKNDFLSFEGAIDLHQTHKATSAGMHITITFMDNATCLFLASSIPSAVRWTKHLNKRMEWFRNFKSAADAERSLISSKVKAMSDKAEMYAHEKEKLMHTLEEHEEIANEMISHISKEKQDLIDKLSAEHQKLVEDEKLLKQTKIEAKMEVELAEQHEKMAIEEIKRAYEAKLASIKEEGNDAKAAELENAHTKYLLDLKALEDDLHSKEKAALDAAHAEMEALKSEEEAHLKYELDQLKSHYEDQLKVDKDAFDIQVHEMAASKESKELLVQELKAKFGDMQTELKEQLAKTQAAQQLLARAQSKIDAQQYELDSINEEHRMHGKYFRQVKAFYQKYAADKLEKGQGDAYVNSILHSYKSHEKTLLKKLVAKYAPDYIGREESLMDLLEKQSKHSQS